MLDEEYQQTLHCLEMCMKVIFSMDVIFWMLKLALNVSDKCMVKDWLDSSDFFNCNDT